MEHTSRLIEMSYEQTARFLEGRMPVIEQTDPDGTVETVLPGR